MDNSQTQAISAHNLSQDSSLPCLFAKRRVKLRLFLLSNQNRISTSQRKSFPFSVQTLKKTEIFIKSDTLISDQVLSVLRATGQMQPFFSLSVQRFRDLIQIRLRATRKSLMFFVLSVQRYLKKTALSVFLLQIFTGQKLMHPISLTLCP